MKHHIGLPHAVFFSGLVLAGFFFMSKPAADLRVCLEERGASRQKTCLNNELDMLLVRTKDVNRALEGLVALSGNTRLDDATCHALAHKIGVFAYRNLTQRKSFAISNRSVCGYGFIHGVLETAVAKGERPDRFRSYCDTLDRLSTKEKDTGNCYHGIGHGAAIHQMTEQRIHQLQPEVINPALSLCEQVTGGLHLTGCALGVYHSIGIWGMQHEKELFGGMADPYELCRQQPFQYRVSCFAGIATYVKWIAGDDFGKAVAYIQTIDKNFQEEALMQLTGSFGHTSSRATLKELAIICQRFRKELRDTCVAGFAHHIMNLTNGQRGVRDALDFCLTSSIPISAKEHCIGRVISRVRREYSNDIQKAICSDTRENFIVSACGDHTI